MQDSLWLVHSLEHDGQPILGEFVRRHEGTVEYTTDSGVSWCMDDECTVIEYVPFNPNNA